GARTWPRPRARARARVAGVRESPFRSPAEPRLRRVPARGEADPRRAQGRRLLPAPRLPPRSTVSRGGPPLSGLDGVALQRGPGGRAWHGRRHRGRWTGAGADLPPATSGSQGRAGDGEDRPV